MVATAKTELKRKLFNVTEYYKMLETGLLCENDRVELIHGEIIRMSPIGSKHGGYVKTIANLITRKLGKQVTISVQDSVQLSRFSEPESDVAILKNRDDFYVDSHPTPKDVYFLVEVADTSVGYDFDVKLPLYAAAGIPEIWILDVNAQRITQHSQPDGNVYLEVDTFTKGMTLKCTVLDFELDLGVIFR